MKAKILIQLDPDTHASTFDSIVAIDAGVDQLLQRSNVSPVDVEGLVHGAMFTRGPEDLKSTALFFGGSDVPQTEALVAAAKKAFFGPVRVSLMSDPNGSNTTAAAAVLSVERHTDMEAATLTILAGTGPVGIRIAQIISQSVDLEAATIRVGSRRLEKARSACQQLARAHEQSDSKAKIDWQPVEAGTPQQAARAVQDSQVVFAAGAAGIELIDDAWRSIDSIKVLVDINAVPPAGIAGVDVMDRGTERDGKICYGAIGVGGLKMKIHKKAIQHLFDSNDKQLETREIYQLGRELL